jgi:DNA-binding MarR family transcriptional regulator
MASTVNREHDRARQLLREVECRRTSFPNCSFGIDNWDVFLACYLAELDDKPLSLQELRKQFGLSNTTMLRKIDALEAVALVQRRKYPGDHRCKFAIITDRGRALMTEYLGTLASLEA